MIKIGPAFFDSISEPKISRRRNSPSFLPEEFLSLAPLFFLTLVFAIIIIRLFYVQVLRRDYYKNLSDQNRTRTEIIAAPRGIILDRSNNPLVSNSPSFVVVENGKEKNITREEGLKLISQGKNIKNNIVREYLYKSAFAHVLGYVGQVSEHELILPDFENYGISDTVGKAGLEKQYEKILHGENGKKLFEVDSSGKSIRELGSKEPIPGKNIKTTLDRELQISAKESMENIERGAVVVSDPQTGGILAVYSKPSFDPNVFSLEKSYEAEGEYKTRESILTDNEKQPLLDRAIGGIYPPGSTFKLVSAIAALEKGAIKKDTLIEDTGVLRVGAFSFGNWYFLQHGKTDGNINVIAAIKRSNDIFFYKAAELTGVDKISTFAKSFGMGKALGIDLPGEEKGTIPGKDWKKKIIGEQWYLGDTYNYGIGQGYLLATPLQVNAFTSVFANGGILYEPHLLDQKSRIKNQNFIDKKNIDLVRQGMLESCQSGGVAWPFFDFKVKNERLAIDGKDYLEDASGSAKMTRILVGCKTGTAESGGKETKPHAWITVIAPFYNPEIVVTVLAENSGEGSSVAGPIARNILQGYFERK